MLLCRSDGKNCERLMSYPVERFPRHLLQKQNCTHKCPRSSPPKIALSRLAGALPCSSLHSLQSVTTAPASCTVRTLEGAERSLGATLPVKADVGVALGPWQKDFDLDHSWRPALHGFHLLPNPSCFASWPRSFNIRRFNRLCIVSRDSYILSRIKKNFDMFS